MKCSHKHASILNAFFLSGGSQSQLKVFMTFWRRPQNDGDQEQISVCQGLMDLWGKGRMGRACVAATIQLHAFVKIPRNGHWEE